MRVRREVRTLRTKKRFQAIRRVFVAVLELERNDFRIIDWSLQGDHIHLIIEASDQPSLSRGMKGLAVRLARAINRVSGRRGTVFAERYFSRVLCTPREVRHARAYVMLNARRHTREASEVAGGKWVDEYSSWAWFDGWEDLPGKWLHKARAGPEAVAPVAKAETWLLRIGWKRHGLIRLTENPGGVGRGRKRIANRAGEGR
jgi:REP element-mobilizing transposase RayT